MSNLVRPLRFILPGLFLLLIVAGFWWLQESGPANDYTKTVIESRSQPESSMQPRVPVIIYLVDSLRADRLGLYGYDRTTSWRLDGLAGDAVVFDRAYAPAPWTLPSLTSLITSSYACEHGLLDGWKTLSPTIRTLAERLQELGYFTGVSYNNAFAGPLAGLNRGYEVFTEHDPGVKGEGRAPAVRAFLHEAESRPFFLYVHTMEPHDTYLTPFRFIRRFGEIDPDKEMAGYPDSWYEYKRLRHVDWKAGQPLGSTDNTIEQDALFAYFRSLQGSIDDLYDASVLWADANLGEVVDVLKKGGVWDSAIFIFVSDHGEELGDHGGWFHGQSVYEELVRVPLIIHFPGGEFAGRRIGTPVSLIDIMPTIFDYLGRPGLCEGCRGRSLLPLLRDVADQAEGGAAVQAVRINRVNYYRPWKESRGDINVVIRQDRWKGIWNAELSRLELYDLAVDPGERSDLSGDYPELAAALGAKAHAWLADCQSRAIPPDEHGEIDAETQEKLRALGYFN
jgi:arylsulfatase A-like enzyme